MLINRPSKLSQTDGDDESHGLEWKETMSSGKDEAELDGNL